MAYSSANTETGPEENEGGAGDGNAVEKAQLQNHYQLLIETSPLPEDKKQACRDWVKTNPEENDLRYAIAEWDKAVQSYTLWKQYEVFAKDFEKKGIIGSAREWIEWFQKQKLGDKEKYVQQLTDSLKKADLENTTVQKNSLEERYKFYKILAKLPRAEREKLKNSLGGESFETSKKKIEAAVKTHQKLKTIFLGLPKELQAKHKDAFKAMTLDEREKFLKSIAVLSPEAIKEGEAKGLEAGEKKEKRKTLTKFRTKLQRMLDKNSVDGNLLAPKSAALYEAWAEEEAQKLSAIQLKQLLGYKDEQTDRDVPGLNDLDRTMEERKKARSLWNKTIYPKLPPEMCDVLNNEFLNADFEKRNDLIVRHKQKLEGSGRSISYLPAVFERYINEALEHPSLKQSRLLLSFAQHSFTWRRRAELMYKTTADTDSLTEKAEEAGRDVDEAQEFNIEQLKHHGEVRHQYMTEVVRPGIGKGQNAMAPNLRLLNEQKREVSAQEFDKQIRHHQEEEVIAGILNKVSQRLPGASRESIRRAIKPSRLILSDHQLITMAA